MMLCMFSVQDDNNNHQHFLGAYHALLSGYVPSSSRLSKAACTTRVCAGRAGPNRALGVWTCSPTTANVSVSGHTSPRHGHNFRVPRVTPFTSPWQVDERELIVGK
ncbi:uncharacterized protein RBU33_005902 isoform 1-T1 [Hipposideros larvatus]